MLRLRLLVLVWLVPSPLWANIVGSDFQNFNPIPSGLDFVTVHSSETLKPCVFNLGLYYNRAFNSLPYYESLNVDEFRNRSNYSDTVDGVDFNMGLGLTQNWEIGISIPSIVNQTVETDALISGQFTENGLTEIRPLTKYRFWGNDSGGGALIASANINQVENNVYLGRDAGPTYNLEAAIDDTFGKVNAALNFGYRWRDPGTQVSTLIAPLTDAFIYSVGLSYLVPEWDTKLILETFGSYPTETVEGTTQKQSSNLEGFLAAKVDWRDEFSFLGGFGTEIQAGTATPDWRFFLGINLATSLCGNKKPQELVPVEKPASERRKKRRRLKVEPLPPVDQPQDFEPDLTAIPTSEIQSEAFITPTPEPTETFVLKNVNFGFNSSTKVYPGMKSYLEKLARHIEAPPGYQTIVITGHTDSIGPADYNLKLSRQRAVTIGRFLVDQFGLDKDRIKIRAKGESVPIADNGNYQGRRDNRRVEFEVYR